MTLQRGLPQNEFNFIPCNGKPGVYYVRDRVKGSYPNNRVSFVVDADHDRFLGWDQRWAADVFVTDYYSVESYIASIDVFVACLKQHAGLQANDPVLESVRTWYELSERQFAEAMVRPMAIAIAWRRIHGGDSLHLDTIALHNFIRIPDAHELIVLAALDEHLLEMADEARREEIRKIADVIEVKLRARNCKCWIRGKFLSWWFSHYFNSVAKKLAREFRDQNNLDIQCGLTMGQKQFIALLTHHAGVPKRLRLFFERRLGGSNSVALV